MAHQPRRKIHRVSEAREGVASLMTVGAAAQTAISDADLQLSHRRELRQVAQLERCGGGARGVVLVRLRRAEYAIEISTLVAYRQVDHVAAVGEKDALGVSHERIQLRRCI